MLTAAAALLTTVPLWPQAAPKDLGDKSIEDLMNIEVTSVSKKEQKLSTIASAIFVITQDDIRRSGALNLPDVLRMVPGLEVAQVNGGTWEISARGFNAQFANKLLVLIDGRTVYSPLFSGVYWDAQDVPLEDIDRIEVIRGPGATVWGANAVNGVINIITKSAKETKGGLVTAGAGTHALGFGVAQYGGTLGAATDYRVFMEGFGNDSYPSRSGQGGQDGSELLHGGFRADSVLSKADTLTVQGDLYSGNEGAIINLVTLTPPYVQPLAGQIDIGGGDVLGRWNHTFSPASATTLQIYFDRTTRSRVIESEDVNTFDVDFQHHVGWGSRQDFVWGGGYRNISYVTTGSLDATFNPASQELQVFTGFVQDEITLLPDRLHLTIGAKLEHNYFAGFEFQPSARIAWQMGKDQTIWAGYAGARRTPSPVDREINYSYLAFPGPGGVPILLSVLGNADKPSEDLNAFEAGYRAQLRSNVSLDVAMFYNVYGQLTTYEPGTQTIGSDPPPLHVDVPLITSSLMYGETQGVEMAGNWKITSRWTVSPGYALERIHLHLKPTSHDVTSVSTGEGNSPHVQAQLRSTVELPRRFEWNTSVYYVDRLPSEGVPSYTRLDTNIIWKASEHLSVSVVGQNLLQDHHLEVNSSDQDQLSSLIKRSGYVKFEWHF